MLLERFGQRPRMLYDFTIHIDDVEAAIRCVGELNGTEPVVGAGKELDVLLVGRTFGTQANAVGTKFLAMNQIPARVPDEGVADELRAVGVAAIDGHAGRAREVAAGSSAAFDGAGSKSRHAPLRADDPPRFIRADAKHGSRTTIDRDIHERLGQREEGIPLSVTLLVHHHLDVVGVGADKFPPAIIKAHPMLSASAFGAHFQGARIEGEVATAKVQRCAWSFHWR